MATTTRSTVVAVFPDVEKANLAIKELLRSGFTNDNIGFMVRSSEERKELHDQATVGQLAAERGVGGALIGGVVGGLLGAVTAVALPVIGPVLVAGLLMAGGGAIVGTFTGLMSTVEMPKEEIRWYQSELEAGRPIVVVRTNGRYSEALSIMQIHGAYDMTRQRELVSSAADAPK